MKKNVFIYRNETKVSKATENEIRETLQSEDYIIHDELDNSVELIFCIGGDGTFLDFLQQYDFPEIHIVGVNTGTLGFFQEIEPKGLKKHIEKLKQGKYKLQKINPVKAVIKTKSDTKVMYGMNEIALKAAGNYLLHLNVAISNEPIEKFNGDGILISTSTGSTAYNYSLGGGIVDPRLKLLQVTPMAPLNSTAYRTFTSSIILPDKRDLVIKPETREGQEKIFLCCDRLSVPYDDIKEVAVSLSPKEIQLVRSEDYNFWSKVKSKFL